MPRIVKCGLIQTSLAAKTDEKIDTIRDAQVERTLKYIDQAGQQGVQMLCMQEIFTGPYFCAEQNTRWYDAVERIPDGPTTKLMQEYAKKYKMGKLIPHSRVVITKGSHLEMYDDQQTYFRELVKFIKDVEAGKF